jgi:hypothetical protein
VALPLGLTVVEPPFGRVELIETLWWHPDRASTPEHVWLRRILTEAAASLPPVADGFGAARALPPPVTPQPPLSPPLAVAVGR